jgi:hypothetical protein
MEFFFFPNLLLTQVSRDASISGQFKLVLGGNSIIHAEIQAKDMLQMGGASAFMLHIERWPRDIKINLNTTTSDWFDLSDRYANLKFLNIINIFFMTASH